MLHFEVVSPLILRCLGWKQDLDSFPLLTKYGFCFKSQERIFFRVGVVKLYFLHKKVYKMSTPTLKKFLS